MDVTGLVARTATRRVHVFLVETPGFGLLRMLAQAAIAERGWVEALGPADADALVVCGTPSSQLDRLIDAVWQQIPSPRHRVLLEPGGSLNDLLNSIPAVLRDDPRQRTDARTRRLVLDDDRGPAPAVTPHGDDAGSGAGMDPGMEMDMDMDMDMSGPAGIPLAGGDNDRDGLEMDVTHLTMGPLLAEWPADLVLHCSLHGDVVVDARAELLPWPDNIEQPPEAARLLDDAARLLSVAGWEPAAQQLARLRDDVLAGGTVDRLLPRLRRVASRLRRSRSLRWSLSGLPQTPGTPLRARLLDWVQTVLDLVDPALVDPDAVDPAQQIPAADLRRPTSPDDIRLAVIGQELAATRLIIAGLGSRSRVSGSVSHE
ncbi:MAG: hypothetical protein H7146_06125 [Burkholderiaceae bacterium]|nr:hypothetical protein [Microbacteriaceae bacterium]